MIAVVTSGFPRRSETFALNELLALEERGALAALFATKPGDGAPLHPGAARLAGRVELLPPGPPKRQAAVVADRLHGLALSGIHAYFAHEPAAVAMHAARRLGLPFGFSVHARDARKVSAAELAHRGRRAACVIACNADVAGDVRRAGVEPQLLPHGVDLRRFRGAPPHADGPLALLAVGRLVPKKGFGVLIEAAARLSGPFRLRIVGEGPERPRLERRVAELGLAERVQLAGASTHAELPGEYAAADLVAVPSVADPTGDRDGLPNVVLEAMASGRPVVASNVGAIATAVAHGDTGLLVPPGDVAALADALEALSAAPVLCHRLAHAGRERVERDFDLKRCTARLHRALEEAYG